MEKPIDDVTDLEPVQIPALVAMQEGEINSQIATAKRFPRSIEQFRKRALGMVTLSTEIAQSCYYKLKRGQKIIEGPSVRLAEIALSCWTNLRAGSRVISIDDSYVRSQGAFMDLETNSAVSVEVVRRITNAKGQRYDDDMVMTTSNAANSIAFRNACFKVIPGVFVQELLEAARKCARGDTKTLETRVQNAFQAFSDLGVSEKKVLLWLGRKGKREIDLQDLENLFGLLTAIKDGETTAAETFDKLSAKPQVSDPKELKEDEAAPEGMKEKEEDPPAVNKVPEENDAEYQEFQTAVFALCKKYKKKLSDVSPILKKSGFVGLSTIPADKRTAAIKAIEAGLK